MTTSEKTAAEAPVTPAPASLTEAPAPTASRRRPTWMRPSYWIPPIALLAVIVAGVYVINWALGPRGFLMPRPEQVLAVYFDPKNGPDIFAALWVTAQVALVGLVAAIILGVAWAITMNLAK